MSYQKIIPRKTKCLRLSDGKNIVYVLVYGTRCGYKFKKPFCDGCYFNKRRYDKFG